MLFRSLEIRLVAVLESGGKLRKEQGVAGYPVHKVLTPSVKLVAGIAVILLVKGIHNGIHTSFYVGVVKIYFKFSVINSDNGDSGGGYKPFGYRPAVYAEFSVVGVAEFIAHFKECVPSPVIGFVKLVGIAESVFGNGALSVPKHLIKIDYGKSAVIFAAPFEHFHGLSCRIPKRIAKVNVLINGLEEVFPSGIRIISYFKLEDIGGLPAYHHFAKLVISCRKVHLDIIENIVGVVSVGGVSLFGNTVNAFEKLGGRDRKSVV